MAAAAAGAGDMREADLPDEARAARLLPGAVHRTLVATENWLPALAVGVAAFGALIALLLVLLELDLLVVAMVVLVLQRDLRGWGVHRDFGPEDYEMLLALDEHTPTKMIARASRGEISRLPTINYTPPREDPSDPAKTKEEARTRCLVCLEDFVPGETLRLLPCIHFFHAKCIDRWLGEKAECPVCKSSIRDGSDGGASAAP
ncbi:hypothetical protein FNF28_02971 [Cafeteria roenbergensis]|uniref:RING-type domain-containing protein n=1 Tax=Cafeteria roenbergensis TaxID=33653 RepID=A0A5A8DP02_CAFRO|nr:hypothetical protein FNF28_02971 [Cafeteria roenbergensis]